MKKYNLIINRNSENKILMIRRKNMPFHYMWNLPGGKIEESESIIDSAIRENIEETNIYSDNLRLIHISKYFFKDIFTLFWYYNKNIIFEKDILINKKEVLEYKFMSLEDMSNISDIVGNGNIQMVYKELLQSMLL